MNTANNTDFGWDKLLSRIKRKKKIIPVIGHGLFQVEVGSGESKNRVSLYDYLADQVLAECGAALDPSDESHRFAKACLEFLNRRDNDHELLSEFLAEKFKAVSITKDNNPLGKLARIKNFNVFINTAYDNLLAEVIRNARRIPTKVLYYTPEEKKFELLNDDLFNSLRSSLRTLVYHIFGSMEEDCISPAYTEKDILETIVTLQKDMERNPGNNLFQKLKESSLLFIGCGYDDWLLRFFIRTVANEPYELFSRKHTYNFVWDAFYSKKKDPFQELHRFLKNYKAEVFYSSDGVDFVDTLFKKVQDNYPEGILPLPDFSGMVFISYERNDSRTAIRLAKDLENNGFDVWLDKFELEQEEDVDAPIIKAIDNCLAFIPLISHNSERFKRDENELKYHVREWERAYTNMKSTENDRRVTIIPVTIDNTGWMYGRFEEIADKVKVLKSDWEPGLQKLIGQLKKIQKKS
ncbi:MAG: toll/interleukin-1 receptor domain-containing protein [bacterium]|nr:toll/interleukin-1 receptor domain-containing protein [bacterium]